MPQANDPECNKKQTNLYQQMAGGVMYASLLRPDLMYYASQLGQVMSKPSLVHLRLARIVIQYCNATAEEEVAWLPHSHVRRRRCVVEIEVS
jgi:hypothetical protein